MQRQLLFVLSVCFLVTTSLISGCVDEPKETTALSIVSFTVEPTIIEQGENANLNWTVRGASSVTIDNGIGPVTLTGNLIITPTQTTTYILTASNATTTKSATVTITVHSESNESDENQEILIASFEVNPGQITLGQSATLSWVVRGATSVSINNGIGNVPLTGNRSIWPTITTTYTLVASNAVTSKQVSITIYVLPQQPAPDMAFSKQTTPTKGILLVSADPGLFWEEFTITAAETIPTGAVIAGQFIALSSTSTTMTIVHISSNTLMGSWTWI